MFMANDVIYPRDIIRLKNPLIDVFTDFARIKKAAAIGSCKYANDAERTGSRPIPFGLNRPVKATAHQFSD